LAASLTHKSLPSGVSEFHAHKNHASLNRLYYILDFQGLQVQALECPI